MEQKIELGDVVKSIYTGFTGIATARIEFINGCIQYEVTPKCTKDNVIPEGISIDEKGLVIIKKRPKPKTKPIKEEESNGGPNHRLGKMRGY